MADTKDAPVIEGFKDLAAFVKSLRKPRRIIMLVKAGEVVDKTIAALRPLLNPAPQSVDDSSQ